MSRTYKTAPYWVRKVRAQEAGLGAWKSACGTGCRYCGMSRLRRRHEHHAVRNRVRQELHRGIRCEAYGDDVHPVWVHIRQGY
jgi:hypothetical protein